MAKRLPCTKTPFLFFSSARRGERVLGFIIPSTGFAIAQKFFVHRRQQLFRQSKYHRRDSFREIQFFGIISKYLKAAKQEKTKLKQELLLCVSLYSKKKNGNSKKFENIC